MKIIASQSALKKISADVLAIGIQSGNADVLSKLDKELGSGFRDVLVNTKFTAEFGEVVDFYLPGIKANKILLFGLGEDDINIETQRRFAGRCAKFANKNKAETMALYLPPETISSGNIKAIAEALWLSNYRFLKYKTDADKSAPTLRKTIIINSINNDQFENEVRSAAAITLGVTLARNLVNEPSNIVTPRYIKDAALEIADSSDKIEVGVLGEKHLIANNFGAFLAVAKGSKEEPYLIHLVYKPKKPKLRVAVVGKGITFDSGGISLKPSDKLDEMKMDMAGAAAVLGLFRSLSIIDVPIEVHGVIPACENMPGGGAIKPGDVVRSYSNKTIEVLNTDAEGRLVLADALSYVAKNFFPNIIIDMATLTGSCISALGDNIAGLMTHSDKLSRIIEESSTTTGEKIWRLPLEADYQDQMKSDIADIKNITDTKSAGAIMGGMFLQEFVPEEIEFAHIDIAGPSWVKKDDIGYTPKGATGFGVRMLLELILTLSQPTR